MIMDPESKNKSQPPHSVESERGVLGSMLMEPDRVVGIFRHKFNLGPDAFHLPTHQTIMEVILELDADPKIRMDMLIIRQRLQDKGVLGDVGGVEYLEQLIDETPTAAHAEAYIEVVRQKYFLRCALQEAQLIQREAMSRMDGEALLRAIPERMVKYVDAVHREETNRQAMMVLYDRWEKAREDRLAGNSNVLSGLPTPWESVNEMTCGIDVGLYIVAGRPSAGKTTVEDCISVYLAQQGVAVARVALDMGWKGRVLQRSACRMSGVSLPKLKMGFASRMQLQAVKDVIDAIGKLPMYINENSYDVDDICSWARSMKFKHDIRLLTIDFVQLVRCRVEGKYMNRNEEIGYITSRLKKLSSDLQIPVMLLSQLSRGVKDGKKEKPPKLDDLRDSGNLEQDARCVWALWKDQRDELLEKEKQANNKLRPVWFDILKDQDGETGRIPFWMRPNYFRFDEAPPDFADTEDALLDCEAEERRETSGGVGMRREQQEELIS
jgi:replicative DNA helicase